MRRYSSYQGASVAPLPSLPVGWKAVPLKAVVRANLDVLDENTPSERELKYVDIGNVDGVLGVTGYESVTFGNAPSRARRLVQHGDVIVSTVRTYLRASARLSEPDENLVVSTGFAVLRPTNDTMSEYLGWVVKSEPFVDAVVARSTGVSYPSITSTELLRIPVPSPSMQEQAAISVFLNRETAALDTLIAEQERLIALLQEKRQAVISHAVTKGLDPNAPVKQSGVEWIGEVPAHWEVLTLRRVISTALQYGASESSDQSEPNWPRFVRITDLTIEGRLREDTFSSLPPDVAQDFLLNVGDVLFSRSGATVGKAAMCVEDWGVCCYAGYLIRAVVDRSQLDARWLVLFTQTAAYWGYVNANQIQATIPNLSAERLAGLPIPVPSVAEQSDIVAHLDRSLQDLDAAIEGCARSIELLRERRAALITAAVTGQIDVRGLVETAA